MAKLVIQNDIPNIDGCVDGYGNSIRSNEIIITEIQQPNTAVPVKTLQECKDEVCENLFNVNYNAALALADEDDLHRIVNEVAEMYASQPKAPVKVVTDKEIKSYANKIYNQWSESDGLSVYDCMVQMAEWMRKQLTGI